jgi:beta-lactamase superfamily II metal-dependent hydrolase
MAYAAERFVSAWTDTVLRKEPNKRSKGLTQCLWGDWVGVRDLQEQGGWLKVHTRQRDGWLQADELTEERLLEVNFVDIGQGDGTFIVLPNDKDIIVDAGAGDNMYRFLSWRFNIRAHPDSREIEAAIITHPDIDHYGGFQRLFKEKKFTFNTVFHNGIVEREKEKEAPKIEALGPTKLHNGRLYLTGLVGKMDELSALLDQEGKVGKKKYPKLLLTARDGHRVKDIRMLAAGQEVFPTMELYGKQLSMKALAPVTEKIGKLPVLRCFGKEPDQKTSGDPGKTKNGHSVVTVLQYDQVRILLGGDLNIPADMFLLDHYKGSPKVFQVDVAKACHHGSADFSTEFLDSVNPLVTVICSGDDEKYSHPRADTLGTVGKHSRGKRSLIFSTELARSAPERIIDAKAIQKQVLNLAEKMADATGQKRDEAREVLKRKLAETIHRSVKVYGMISLRTDGDKVLMAQRLEKDASATRKWDLYPLVRPGKGRPLTFDSKHDRGDD